MLNLNSKWFYCEFIERENTNTSDPSDTVIIVSFSFSQCVIVTYFKNECIVS